MLLRSDCNPSTERERARTIRKGITKESKQARDAALRALDRWMLDFIAVARIALSDAQAYGQC
jgi:hypothetical protein